MLENSIRYTVLSMSPPPKMKRRRMAELEPWIERLIQNYGQSQSETTVKAHVVGACDLSDSQRMEHTDVCLMFLSDGSALIPAVLSGASWERLQDLEERESFSGLVNAVVYVRNFNLDFHMNSDLASCQFYLKVNQMSTICIASKWDHPPSCTTLPSVREQIVKTWRSLRESSVNSVSSASGVSLSSLLGAWHNDIIINILNDALEKINMSATYSPSVATPTHWHRERIHWRGQDQFIVPMPFLLIPEEQRKLMTADPSADCECETPNGLAPPHEYSYPISTSRTNQTLAFQDRNSGLCPDEGQPTLEHTRLEILCGTGELSGDGESPWDMFTPAPDLLGTHSNSDSSGQEPCSQMESQSILKEVHLLPIATSTQAQVVSVDGITQGQRPQPSQISPSHSSGKSRGDTSQEEDKELNKLSPPSWIVQNTAQPSKPSSSVSPPTKTNLAVSPHTKPSKVHSDGTSFSYLYHPDPQVAAALSTFQIPGQFIQWAVRYLGTSDCADVNAGAGS
ncbi:adrenocortical dysplasia protein homolog [Xyrauchen texanus]|uniref:adrenocortical dysplasia protein homolog n=1 Tax=Xyrauchen texanus TaxID=154827 RepID=UPI0022427093|nr:adrenocortical dysplasia protein homolog [Xyrauchen texanus]